MIADFATLYAETFTAEEMKSIADFHRSGAAAEFISLTPELMRKSVVIGMKFSETVVEDTRPVKPK